MAGVIITIQLIRCYIFNCLLIRRVIDSSLVFTHAVQHCTPLHIREHATPGEELLQGWMEQPRSVKPLLNTNDSLTMQWQASHFPPYCLWDLAVFVYLYHKSIFIIFVTGYAVKIWMGSTQHIRRIRISKNSGEMTLGQQHYDTYATGHVKYSTSLDGLPSLIH